MSHYSEKFRIHVLRANYKFNVNILVESVRQDWKITAAQTKHQPKYRRSNYKFSQEKCNGQIQLPKPVTLEC